SATISTWLVPADVEASTSIGTPVTVQTGTPGQNAVVTFDAVAGASVSMTVSQTGYGSSNVRAYLYSPTGQLLWSSGGFGSSKTMPSTQLPGTGTYEVFIDPLNDATGSVTITLTGG
ncbi:MAG: hypothetical protein L0Z47_00840, partial [Actinobacteria bacterium]|nr:hypothetical protein [Actinomycetota bacterium]